MCSKTQNETIHYPLYTYHDRTILRGFLVDIPPTVIYKETETPEEVLANFGLEPVTPCDQTSTFNSSKQFHNYLPSCGVLKKNGLHTRYQIFPF